MTIYQKGTGHGEEYWDVSLPSIQGRMQWNLPRQLSHEVFEMIDGFMGRTPFNFLHPTFSRPHECSKFTV
jgi:hypothetical protein